MESYYKTFYSVYNRINLMNNIERSHFEYALVNQLSFTEAFNEFNDIFLYEVFKIHLAFRPTLKRLSALALIRLLDEFICQNALKDRWHKSIPGFFEEGDLPTSLFKDVVELSRTMWTVDVFYCGVRLLDFFPDLTDPREAVGKEMLLVKSEYDVKVTFRSLTPGWEVNLVLWAIPKIFFVFSLYRENSMCLNEIMSEDNEGQIKIVFLQFVGDKYFFDFHQVKEKLDFTI